MFYIQEQILKSEGKPNNSIQIQHNDIDTGLYILFNRKSICHHQSIINCILSPSTIKLQIKKVTKEIYKHLVMKKHRTAYNSSTTKQRIEKILKEMIREEWGSERC